MGAVEFVYGLGVTLTLEFNWTLVNELPYLFIRRGIRRTIVQ